MPKSCIICSAIESPPDIKLQYCTQCQSALYCSKACQRIDWREKQHKKICKMINVGHGDLHVRSATHENLCRESKQLFEVHERKLMMDGKRFFELFTESTREEGEAAAQNMTKLARRQNKEIQDLWLFHSLHILAYSDSEKLSWPSSPLLVLLELVDPNALSGYQHLEGDTEVTLLHHLAGVADPFNYSTHTNQLILAKQLVAYDANVNASSAHKGRTPLHTACDTAMVTNLDFVEFLLESGADPNAQDHSGLTPLMYTILNAPGAAKFLLNRPSTDANITFLVRVQAIITVFSDRIALPANPEKDSLDDIKSHLMLQQWRGVESMLVERGL
jgi:hypothetical protein